MAESKKVTRITAKDEAPAKVSKPAASAKPKAVKTTEDSHKKNIFARIGAYFKGAWVELRQVRWPNRKATWALTVAVILFSLFFMALILLLDSLFKWLFELIIT